MRHAFLLTILLSLALYHQAAGQKENYVWVFGHNTGINFNSGVPVFQQTNISSWEGAASVSDQSGNLLFYSNGNDVWDRNGNVMPNGSGILGNGTTFPELPCSSTQGVAIVKFQNNDQRYYLFVLDAFEVVSTGYLRYSVVDMSLNGGNGDVMPGQKNIIMDTAIGEQMFIVKGQGCYVWLLVHATNAPLYKAFRIDDEGINPPVISSGVHNNKRPGELKVSPDAKKVAMVVMPGNEVVNGSIELSSFDNGTGIVSGSIILDPQSNDSKYGLSFSPDNSKLYVNNYLENLVQYDITAYPNLSAIENSKTVVSAGGKFTGMRIGPDNKIYMAPATGEFAFISRINNPDLAGAACNVELNALPLPAYSFFPPSNIYLGLSLGNPVVISGIGADTIFRTEAFDLCPGQALTVTVRPDYESFLWSDGNTDRIRTITASGEYTVYGTKTCGTYADLYIVRDIDASVQINEPDTLICYGASVTFHGQSEITNTWLWSTGSNSSSITVSEAGTYILTGTNKCGAFSDSVNIAIKECDCLAFVPTAFSPNSDGNNDIFNSRITCPVPAYQFSVYNRYGQRIFISMDPEAGWDGTFHNKSVDIGTYFYYLKFTSARGVSFDKKGTVTLIR